MSAATRRYAGHIVVTSIPNHCDHLVRPEVFRKCAAFAGGRHLTACAQVILGITVLETSGPHCPLCFWVAKQLADDGLTDRMVATRVAGDSRPGGGDSPPGEGPVAATPALGALDAEIRAFLETHTGHGAGAGS